MDYYKNQAQISIEACNFETVWTFLIECPCAERGLFFTSFVEVLTKVIFVTAKDP